MRLFEGTGRGVAGKVTNVTRLRDICVDDVRQKLHLEAGPGTRLGSYLCGKSAGSDWQAIFRDARRWFEANYESLPKDGIGTSVFLFGSELETRDACHNADKMVQQIKACGRNEMGDFTRYLNTYGLVTTMGNYEGQRATSDKRTFTLTRTAWAGLQRYAAIPWSGDTGASWGRLKDDIAGGLGASMSGLPYWTQDTGGFFCGHYGDAMNNPEFLELLARWNQFAIFNPVYRWHVSSPVAKEPFRAKEKHPEYYESFLPAARLRYRLLPYIYSLARDVHETGRPFVRPAWIDFPGTPGATDDQTSIVFGPSLYTSIITRPVYTGHTTGSGSPVPSEMLTTPDGKAGVKVDYFNDKYTRSVKFWMRTPEEGAFEKIPLKWDDAKKTLMIGAREGSFHGMPKTRAFKVVCGDFSKSVSYDGSEVVLPAVSLAARSTSCMKSTTRCTSR